MIIGILAIIFMVCFLIYEHRYWGISFGTFCFSLLVAATGALIGLFACFIAMGIFMTMPEDTKVVEYSTKTELVALKDNFQVEGSAFLYSSVVNEELKYTYIYDTEMGLTTDSISADDVYIKYVGEDETPYIQAWTKRPKNVIFKWLFYSEATYYTIYLPEGSVIENVYKVDLE